MMEYPRIRDLREDADKSQSDIAAYLQITQQQYSMYESGKRAIPTRVIVALAKYYKTSADDLLGLTDHR